MPELRVGAPVIAGTGVDGLGLVTRVQAGGCWVVPTTGDPARVPARAGYAPAGAVVPAVVGATVCPLPSGCGCRRHHVGEASLRWLTRREGESYA